MKKTLFAVATAATLAFATLAPTTADARCRGCGIAAGIIGGAIIGSAIVGAYAYPRTYYPVQGYEPYPVYAGPAPIECPGGYWARRQFVDQYGNVRWSRPRFFCPQY